MNQKETASKIANNMLEFLIDPTVVPVRQHLYFRPEEILRNEAYEGAKADAQKAYGDQRHNSDFYPIRNRTKSQKEGSLMDRRTMIASLDVLSQNFNENDPIATDLRTMAYAVSKMSDEELQERTANAWMDLMKKVRNDPKNKGKSVGELAGIAKKLYKKEADEKEEACPKCGKSECSCMKEASEEVIVKEDFWTKEASDAVAKALVAEVTGAVEAPVEEQQEEHEKTETPEEEAKEHGNKDADQNDPRFMYQKGKKDTAEAKKEEAPAVEPKKEEAPVAEPKKEEAPVVEAKKEEAPAAETKKEEKKEVVDTSVLATEKFDDIELVQGMLASEDIGELTAAEKTQLDKLFN